MPTSTETKDRLGNKWGQRQIKFLTAVLIIALITAGAGAVLVRRVIGQGWPQSAGTVTLANLDRAVTVVRDQYGVPHIYADGEADLYFAQGYVHAQDRFWQMHLYRRQARGALAEILGSAALREDEAWKALNLTDIADQELARMETDTSAQLEAYAAGVNAWLDRGDLPLEFSLLEWQGRRAEQPDAWTVTDSLLVSLGLSWQTGLSPIDGGLRERIAERVGVDDAAFLLEGDQNNRVPFPGMGRLEGSDGFPPVLPRRWRLESQVAVVKDEAGTGEGRLFAIDLPIDLGQPTPWYVTVLHAPGITVAGASVPGLPGVLVGTNETSLLESVIRREGLDGEASSPPWKSWLLAALLTDARIVDPTSYAATAEELESQLTDTFSMQAAQLIPSLLQVEPEGWRQKRVTGMLRKWDYRLDDNKESPFYAVFQLEVARAAFADELGATLFEEFVAQSDQYQTALDRILDDPNARWWDDVNTPQRELRKDILRRAYEHALEWLGRNYGDLHMLWEWGIVHGSRLHHALGTAWPWDQLLSRDLAPAGWADTVNASPGGLPCVGGICEGGDLFRATAVYGYRQIIDASDPSTVWFLLLPGQSGHPFHVHYDDLMDRWSAGDYLALHIVPSPGEIKGGKEVLVLSPENGRGAD